MKLLLSLALLLSLTACADYAYQRGCNGPLPTLYKCR
jgi:hypothetical protein